MGSLPQGTKNLFVVGSSLILLKRLVNDFILYQTPDSNCQLKLESYYTIAYVLHISSSLRHKLPSK